MDKGDLGDLLRSAASSNWKAGQKLGDVIVKGNGQRHEKDPLRSRPYAGASAAVG